MAIIETYLPEQVGDEEVEAIIDELIAASWRNDHERPGQGNGAGDETVEGKSRR